MIIHPHKSVGDFPFGAPRATLLKTGTPLRERLNRIGELELDYGKIVYRFEQDRFVEATFPLPAVLEVDDQRVEGCSLIAFLKKNDPCFREAQGFAIAPSFGLAVDLDEDDPNRWTTAFAAGRWDRILK